MKLLRQKLRKKLNRMEGDVLAGRFDKENGALDMDQIETECRPVIYECLPENHAPHEPADAFRMCVDIIRKRRRYLQHKQGIAVLAAVKQEEQRRDQAEDNAPAEQANADDEEQANADDDFSMDAVNALFSSQESQERSPAAAAPPPPLQCLECTKNITRQEAFPESARAGGDLVIARCEECWQKYDNENVEEDLYAQRARLEEKNRLV